MAASEMTYVHQRANQFRGFVVSVLSTQSFDLHGESSIALGSDDLNRSARAGDKKADDEDEDAPPELVGDDGPLAPEEDGEDGATEIEVCVS
jgi:hypothetical protein